MLEKTCGNCKYFGPPVLGSLDLYDENGNELPCPVYHECGLLKHLNSYRRDRNLEPLTEVAGVIDGSGYSATFCVQEEFGCNQWKVKNP